MKHKYLTIQTLIVCRRRKAKKDIHEQLRETILERKRLFDAWGKRFGETKLRKQSIPERKAA